ncbi:MAG: bifunctional oligoribonuclease/PAP phosphatase NrnA [Faecousia sp.]
MSIENMKMILQKIKEYDRIMLFRHIRNDGDCVGSTKGLKEVILATWPEKKVHIIDPDDYSHFLDFLGPDDEDVADELYAEALGIVIDTGTTKRISNQKYRLCKELIKIDHHIPLDNYGDFAWVEEEKSSACEMITQFVYTFREELKMTPQAARYLYTGMVTDSGRFRFRSVSGDTMRYAGYLLDQGIDTDTLYAHLYLESLDHLKFKAYVYNHIQQTENGVAYLYVDRAMQEQFGLTLEGAGSAISFLESIEGCICWIAFIENGDADSSIRVRLRSRFVAVNTVGEHFRGGGHDCACGATVYGEKEVQALLAEADAVVKHYKQTHEGWL